MSLTKSVLRPVKFDPSPLKAVAVRVPVTVAPDDVVSNFFTLLWYNSTAPFGIKFANVSLPEPVHC